MAFEPENRLEEALVKAKTDVLARPVFYQLLMAEPLVVAGEIVHAADGAIDGMNLALIRHNGRDYHPLFSSLTRLRAIAPAETRHFAAVGRDLFRRTQGADFVLNPGNESGKILTANEIAFWLDPSARARRTLQKNQPHAIITTPREHQKKLLEALSVLFVNRHDVVKAHCLEVKFSDRSEPAHPLIVIEQEGAWTKLASEISQLAAAIVPDLVIDVIANDPAHPDPQLAQPLSDLKPFFQRTPME